MQTQKQIEQLTQHVSKVAAQDMAYIIDMKGYLYCFEANCRQGRKRL